MTPHRRCLSLISSLVLLFLLIGPAAASDGAWTSFRGDGTGRAVKAAWPDGGALSLEKRWSREIGSGYAGIVLGGGLLVTAAAAGERDVVVALDPENGAERWRYDLAPTYPGHDGSHDGPIATPAIAGGRVFALGAWGHLAAVGLADGQEIWTRHLTDELGSPKPSYGFGSSPAVAAGIVILQVGGEDGSVAGFDAATGELRWRNHDDGVFSQSPVVAQIGDREQIVVIGFGKVAGLDPKMGEILWEYEHQGGISGMGSGTSSPLPLDDGRVFFKHGQDTTMVLGVKESSPGYETALLHEIRGLSKSYSPPALWGGRVYGFTGRLLSAVDTATGELLWRSRQPGDGFLVAAGGQLVVLTKKGSLHLGAARPDGWTESARLDLFSDHLAWTPPSVAGHSVYARSLGEIARVDVVAAKAPVAVAETVLPSVLGEIAGADDKVAAVRGLLAGKDLPLIDGHEVVFLWRGEADDVAVAGDMIGMRREEAMRRLDGTDLWWWATELDPRARISYLFLVDDEPTVDPSHLRRVQSTVLGPDMNWQRRTPLEMSWFAMPEWPGWNRAPSPHRGHMETVQVPIPHPEEGKPALMATLHVWLPPGYATSAERYPVVYVHQPRARDDGRWPETLDRVVGRTVEPLIAVFVEGPRMRDFGAAFAKEVVPFVDERYRTRAERDGRANVGMGWQGGAALTLSFAHSDLFGRVGVQSFYGLTSGIEGLKERIGDATAEDTPLRIYLEWGKWDLVSPHEAMDMRRSSRWLDGYLRARGFAPIGGEVADSTDFASWRNRTDVLLEALFPLAETASPSGLERWLTATR